MRLLVIAPDLGLGAGGRHGGVAAMGRLLTRAFARAKAVSRVTVWSLLDSPGAAAAYAETFGPGRALEARGFGGKRAALAGAILFGGARRHDHVTFLHPGPARTAPALRGVPFSVWLLGIESWIPLNGLTRKALARASRVFSISAHTAARAREANPWLAGADVVHLGLERGLPPVEAPPPSRRSPTVLMVSRLDSRERYKGHDQALDAWPEVLGAVPDADLVVAGGGDDLDRLRRKAAALPRGASNHVRFLGSVGDDALDALYRESRVFLLPSTGEGFGLVFAEAMRAGTPCVCAGGAPAEIVCHGLTGNVTAPSPEAIARAVIDLLTDDAKADRYGDAGRARFAEHFAFDAVVRRIERVVANLASRTPAIP